MAYLRRGRLPQVDGGLCRDPGDRDAALAIFGRLGAGEDTERAEQLLTTRG